MNAESQPPLALWSAFEKHLRTSVSEIAHADDLPRIPPLGSDDRDRSQNVLLYMEVMTNYLGAQIPAIPHEVFFASELTSSPEYTQFKARIDRISELLKTAAPEINDPNKKYLSRRVEYAFSFNKAKAKLGAMIDRQLREIGIRHFHLGGDAKRTDDLLMGILREGKAYLIGVYSHRELYTNAPLLRAQTNWPGLFETLSGVSGMTT